MVTFTAEGYEFPSDAKELDVVCTIVKNEDGSFALTKLEGIPVSGGEVEEAEDMEEGEVPDVAPEELQEGFMGMVKGRMKG